MMQKYEVRLTLEPIDIVVDADSFDEAEIKAVKKLGSFEKQIRDIEIKRRTK